MVVPAFTGSTTVVAPIACSYDLELAAAKDLRSLPDGEAPPALHFNGMIYYPDENAGHVRRRQRGTVAEDRR